MSGNGRRVVCSRLALAEASARAMTLVRGPASMGRATKGRCSMKGSRGQRTVVVVLALAAVVAFASKPSTRTIAKAAPNLTNPARLDTASQARLVDAYGK